MANQKLVAVVMPTGDIQLEWLDAEDEISKSKKILEEEIFNRFKADQYAW
ncbi:MAG: hypothetical protein HQK78_07445, partial [Desulfobacterales bacterium]|nr:hypothetical protein [Desulfobacterales bacterium]